MLTASAADPLGLANLTLHLCAASAFWASGASAVGADSTAAPVNTCACYATAVLWLAAGDFSEEDGCQNRSSDLVPSTLGAQSLTVVNLACPTWACTH